VQQSIVNSEESALALSPLVLAGVSGGMLALPAIQLATSDAFAGVHQWLKTYEVPEGQRTGAGYYAGRVAPDIVMSVVTIGAGAVADVAAEAVVEAAPVAAEGAESGIAAVAKGFGERNASIFTRAAEIISETGGSTFLDHLGALATAVGEKVPMGQVWQLGELNGQPIFGAIRNGLGIVETEGGTMIVHAPQGGPVTTLGPLLP
jgi:hypothetical protein